MTKNIIKNTFITISCTSLLSACATSSTADKTQDVQSDERQEVAQKVSVAPAVGLNDADNNPDVVALAKTVLEECTWQGGEPQSSCQVYKTYKKSSLIKDAESLPTLMNFVEDSDPKVRFLGAKPIVNHTRSFKRDRDVAMRVLGFANEETDPAVGLALGMALGKVVTSKTDLSNELVTLFSTHELSEVRQGVLTYFIVMNPEDEHYAPVIKAAREDANKDVRLTAAMSLSQNQNAAHVPALCSLWLEKAADTNEELEYQYQAMIMLGAHMTAGGCSEQWPALVELIEAHAAKGQLDSSLITRSMDELNEQAALSEEMRTRLMTAARSVVTDTSNAGGVRMSTLRFIGEQDQDAVTFAEQFTDDSESAVKRTAQDIVDGKIKPKS